LLNITSLKNSHLSSNVLWTGKDCCQKQALNNLSNNCLQTSVEEFYLPATSESVRAGICCGFPYYEYPS